MHDLTMKLIPAGVSRKTGKPYKAFYVCEVEGCTEKGPAPQIEAKEPFDEGFKTPQQQTEEHIDREKQKNDQITRVALAKAFIAKEVDFDNAVLNNDLTKWEHWVITGELE